MVRAMRLRLKKGMPVLSKLKTYLYPMFKRHRNHTSKPVAAPAADKKNIAGNTGEAVKAPMRVSFLILR
jgi:hypothetical protein